MLNPAAMMKMMNAFKQFNTNHPKVIAFFKVVFSNRMEEGTVIEVTVTKPGEEPMTTNMKITQSDLALFEEIKAMSSQMN